MKESSLGFLGRRSNLWFGAIVSGILVLYAAVFIARPEQFFADDSFFYLQVAWNFARGMGSTFNTIMPTNGYHPLWMLICAAVYKLVPSKMGGMHGIAVVITLLDALMLWTVRRVVQRVAGDLWILAFSLLIPFSFLSQLGTEEALSCLFLALLMLTAFSMATSPATGAAFGFNLVAAIAVLSRLDNIFIVGFVWVAVWIALRGETGRAGRRLQLAMLPIYGVLWGAYLASNWIYFHTLQPISGLLKSDSSRHDHSLGQNLPHTAWFALVVIAICFLVVVLKKRDLFFRVVEVPFLLGVLCHCAYIVLRMSNETRWSWYYTSWILLAAVLLARAGSVVMLRMRWSAVPVTAVIVVLLAYGWVRSSYVRYWAPPGGPPASFNETVYKQAGIHRAFAYDQPGVIAFFTDVEIVPLDGLMGDMTFQHDLGTKGVNAIAAEDHIDGFIAPPGPYNEAEKKMYCDQIFLSAVELHCVADGPGQWQATGADISARVPSAPAGRILLDPDKVVWKQKKWMMVWKITPTEAR